MRISFLAVLVALDLHCHSVRSEGVSYSKLGSGNKGGPKVFLGGLFPIHAADNGVCGDILDLGIQRQEAMVYAVNEINRNSALLRGITLAFDIRDTCTSTSTALGNALSFITQKRRNGTCCDISGIVGPASSDESIIVANLVRLFHIPQISYASTATSLSDKSRYDYFFRTIPPDYLQARALVDIAVYFNWTYVIAINSKDEYGVSGMDVFTKEFTERNDTARCIAVRIQVSPAPSEMEADLAVQMVFRPYVSNASVVVLFGQLATAKAILEAVARIRLQGEIFSKRNLTWLASDAWGDQLSEYHSSIATNIISAIPKYSASIGFDNYFQNLTPSNNVQNPWFAEYWEKLFNCSLNQLTNKRWLPLCNITQRIGPTSGYRQNSKVPFTIDAVYAIAHAISNLQQDMCSGDDICNEIVDHSNDRISINGELLKKYLQSVNFSGESADVIHFNQNGDQEGSYFIKALNAKYQFEIIGFWDASIYQLHFEKVLIWNQIIEAPRSICSEKCKAGERSDFVSGNSYCCWTCVRCTGSNEISTGTQCFTCPLGFRSNVNKTSCIYIIPTALNWSSPWSIIIVLLASFGIIATVSMIIVYIGFRNQPLVKASSRELSGVLLIGILLCYLLPFFFILKPSTVICASRRFGVGFCFSICYSALLVKTNRMHRIFNRKKITVHPPPLISSRSQLVMTAGFVLVQIVIAITWIAIERPGIAFNFHDSVTEIKCNESPHIGLSVSLGYNLILLICSTYFAFRTRKIPQNFNEAKFINLTLYTICIIWLAFIPTYFTTASLGTTYQTSCQVFAITLSATTTLVCLFFSKIYVMVSKMRKEKSEQLSSNNDFNRNIVANKRNSFIVAMSHLETQKAIKTEFENAMSSPFQVQTCQHQKHLIEKPCTNLVPLAEEQEMVVKDSDLEKGSENAIIIASTTV